MRTVGIRNLKDRLSEYIRAVRAGEHVLITDRGAVVAELVPPGGAGQVLQRGLAELSRRGAKLGTSGQGGVYPSLPRVAGDGDSSTWLDEERGER